MAAMTEELALHAYRHHPAEASLPAHRPVSALRGASPFEAAAILVDRTLDGSGGELAASAAVLLGDLAAEEGNRTLAERYYRRVLRCWPSWAGCEVEISLAALLVENGHAPDLAEARLLLDTYLARPGAKPDDQLFRWHLVNLALADLTGEDDRARESAIMALELAGRGRHAPSHDAEGTVDAREATLRRLRERIGLRS